MAASRAILAALRPQPSAGAAGAWPRSAARRPLGGSIWVDLARPRVCLGLRCRPTAVRIAAWSPQPVPQRSAEDAGAARTPAWPEPAVMPPGAGTAARAPLASRPLPPLLPFSAPTARSRTAEGAAAALAIGGLWAVSLAAALCVPSLTAAAAAARVPPALVALALGLLFAARTFSHTGLFITAHEAMHSSLLPSHPRLNAAAGALCLCLFATLPYGRLRAAHFEHHAHPGEPGGNDPDFYDGGFWRWALGFFSGYVSPAVLLRQTAVNGLMLPLVAMAVHSLIAAAGAAGAAGVAAGAAAAHALAPALRPLSYEAAFGTVALFGIAPAILASLQLFLFGIYLPHRREADGLRTRSSGYPPWLSFATSYHFGYHVEHHACPWLPWFRLPLARAGLRAGDERAAAAAAARGGEQREGPAPAGVRPALA